MDIRSRAFDEAYTYDGDDLGCTYTESQSLLKLWAPTAEHVICQLQKLGDLREEPMTKEERGIWSLMLEGDWEGWTYVYKVTVEGQTNTATDPYAIASTPNHERTVIIDPQKTVVENHGSLPPHESYTDAVVYELHVRDFSVGADGGFMHRGKYLGLTEEGTVTSEGEASGVDYLTSLGITHVQLLPVYDFASVDEHNQFGSYNWGYDPVQYNVPEGSYATDIHDPYARIIELKKAIALLHSKGLRVIMDVVYNHMYDRDSSAFHRTVPGYYFRTDEDGNISNGSFCGNDIDSTRPMMRKFLMASTRMWIEEYGFDGFRFDLMGILDVDTMNAIAEQTLRLKPDAMIYGEGWNMPTFLSDDEKATMMNHEKMPNIGHFSDIFREAIKGGTSDDKLAEVGYGGGDVGRSVEAAHLILGTTQQVVHGDVSFEPYFREPIHTINYVECHDNHTLWDKLKLALPEEREESLRRRHRFITSLVLISQGIPFLHAGQEFYRTKMGDQNSYKSSDEINRLKWEEKDAHLDSVGYVRDLISLRKTFREFRLDTAEAVREYTDVEILDSHCIRYSLNSINGDFDHLLVLINPHQGPAVIDVGDGYEMIFNHTGSVSQPIRTSAITVEGLSVYCLIMR